MYINVLLADDNQAMRTVIARILESDPEIQLVAETANFVETIRSTTKLRPQVVVMDVHLGDEQTVTPSDVKSGLAGSRLLAISIWNDDETKALADRFGAVKLLEKTKLVAQLIPAIKQCAGEHRTLRQPDILEAS